MQQVPSGRTVPLINKDIMEAQIIETLEYRNIKPTSMRMLVLKTLMQQAYAVSLGDLEALFDHADRITLYRTLKTFEKHHLIHRIDDGTGVVKYALCEKGCECEPQDLHIHFHCIRCEKTYCLQESAIPLFSLPSNFKMKEASIVIKGLCEHCNPRKGCDLK